MNRNFGNDGNRGSRERYGNNDNQGSFGNAPPVNVGEEMDVRIEAVGEKGDGVAKKNGFVIFIPGVKEGQNVRIKVTRVLRKVGFGEVIGQASSSPAPAKESHKKQEEQEEEYSAENDSDNFGEEEQEQDSETPSLEDNAESEEEAKEEESEDFGTEEEEEK
jgi:predicted RNA-binding protein with TRAM domain